jgi:glutaminyl-peptide cyclotransferase
MYYSYYFGNNDLTNESTNESTNEINYIKEFTKEISIYRPVGSKELSTVKNLVINEMSKIGLSVEIQSFTRVINNKTYSFSNLIGKNKNVYQSNYILLFAHIDSPQIEGCEASIDSATSIAIILELAKNLIKKNPNYPIMVLFVDGEEAIDGPWGNNNTLSGSKYFVKNYNLSEIKKAYLFDLIGGDCDKNPLSAFSNNPSSINDFKKLSEINKKYKKQIFLNPQNYISDKVIQDDHIPFVEKNVNLLHIIPYNFPFSHHSINDNYSNVNWNYIEIFYKVFYEFLDQN